jgi:hypothetical protein
LFQTLIESPFADGRTAGDREDVGFTVSFGQILQRQEPGRDLCLRCSREDSFKVHFDSPLPSPLIPPRILGGMMHCITGFDCRHPRTGLFLSLPAYKQ